MLKHSIPIALLTTAMLSAPLLSVAQTKMPRVIVSWTPPKYDIEGDEIKPEWLQYNIFAGTKGSNSFSKIGTTPEGGSISWEISQPQEGCWDIRVTAFYTEKPQLESSPSEVATTCINPTQPGGPVFADPSTTTIPPSPPGSVKIEMLNE